MFLRLLSLAMATLIVALQYPLWLGKGGWLKVWQHEAQLEQSQKVNEGLKRRNDALVAEVMDLKEGYDAIEERGRHELGMIKQDELFIQILNTQTTVPVASPTSN